MLLLTSDGKIGLKNGRIAIQGDNGTDCCCFGGCCPDDIVIPDGFGNGTALTATIIAATHSCATVGASQPMNITSPGFWRLDNCLDPACDFGPIVLACGGTPGNPQFTLAYGGFPVCGCPSPTIPPDLVSTTCDPFELVFELGIDASDMDTVSGPCREAGAGCCIYDGNDGSVTIKITKT